MVELFNADLYRESLICARCGYCQAVCPAYSDLGWESSGPRGRMELARRAARGETSSDAGNRRIFQCTLCGHCRHVCPAHIDTGALWLDLRRQAEESGGLAAWPLSTMGRNLGETGNVTGEAPGNRLLWQDNLEGAPAGLNAGVGAPVLLWVGCVGALYPQVQAVPQATVGLLVRAGVRFTTLGSRERCCGFPLLGMGRTKEALEAARANAEAVRATGAGTLVTACPSCYHTWRHLYPGLTGEAPGFAVVQISQMLETLLGDGTLRAGRLEARVTFHDPCDLGRNSGVYDAPRAVIARIPGVEFVEMADSRETALCCGGGGNLEAVDPDLVAAISRRRLAQALDTGAGLLVTSCQQCKRTLANAARRERARIRVLDLTELLLRAME